MARGLTQRQREILDFIRDFIEEKRLPPTLREIGANFDMTSTNGVNDHLKALEKKGYIRRRKDISRGIELMRHPDQELSLADDGPRYTIRSVPILGRVAAGRPIDAAENIEGHVALDPHFWGRNIDYALEVQGDSMINAGIYHGDICLIRQQHTAENNEIIVAMINGDATVKRYRFNPAMRKVTLFPENPAMAPIEVRDLSEFSILGKVVGVMRAL